jgi:hypothetical protein
MTTSLLSPELLSLLRECPITLNTAKGRRLTPGEMRRASHLKALWAARYVKGTILRDGHALTYDRTDRGNEALAAAEVRS